MGIGHLARYLRLKRIGDEVEELLRAAGLAASESHREALQHEIPIKRVEKVDASKHRE